MAEIKKCYGPFVLTSKQLAELKNDARFYRIPKEEIESHIIKCLLKTGGISRGAKEKRF